jgi:hypothetical protein
LAGVQSMSDEQSRRTDAIQTAYNEAHAEFMKAFLLIAELVPELTLEELAEYQRIDEEIAVHQAEQQKQQRELHALGQKATTAEEKFEYVGRLLAVIERNTEQLHHQAEELASLIRGHLAEKEP